MKFEILLNGTKRYHNGYMVNIFLTEITIWKTSLNGDMGTEVNCILLLEAETLYS